MSVTSGRQSDRWYRAVQQAARDPRTAGILRAFPRTAAFFSKANLRTLVALDAALAESPVFPLRPTPALAAQVLLDEIMIASFRHPRLLPRDEDLATAAAEVAAAHAAFDKAGLLADPSGYHEDPDVPMDAEGDRRQIAGFAFEVLRFASGWQPHKGEPGGERWLSHAANGTVHTWLTRPTRSRSWLIGLHGFGMGSNPLIDLRAFRANLLLRQGLNVAVPVLPLHGPRASGGTRGEGFMTINLVDSLHGLAQAAWDVRRLIRWLREEQQAEWIGILGYSLGGHVASLVAALESRLDCVIAGIPVVDLPDLYRRHSPAGLAQRPGVADVLGRLGDDIHRVVSPLAMPSQVPIDRRFIFAGLGDRMATFEHARRLWLHWDRPALATYPGGHVGFFWAPSVRRFVHEALAISGAFSGLGLDRLP